MVKHAIEQAVSASILDAGAITCRPAPPLDERVLDPEIQEN